MEKIRVILRNVKQFKKTLHILRKERNIALKSVFRVENSIEKDVLLHCHSLEKGMGVQAVKHGYGKEKALILLNLVHKMKEIGQENSYAFSEAVAVIKAYIKFQNDNGVDVSNIEKLFSELNVYETSNVGGYRIVKEAELLKGMQSNFEILIKSRHSMRYLADDEITDEEIQRVIEIAKMSPSACNRQPCKIYYSLEKSKNVGLSKYVPGNKSFSTSIPYYCVICADRRLFNNGEMFQWYVNGGIFVAYFSLALHSMGIGNCIFQYPDFYESEDELRKLANIPENESIIAIVGYGKYPKEAKIICADRRPLREVIKKF